MTSAGAGATKYPDDRGIDDERGADTMATTQAQKFRCKIDNAERESLTFICIPFDVKKVFGKARVPVKLTINDFTYRTTICVMGGKYCVPLRRSNREGAGVKAGDVVQVSVVPDSEPRTVE